MFNPIVKGFSPDPSIVCVGGYWYLALSSFQWFPSIPILRSHDLEHWEAVAAVDTAVPDGHLRGVPDSGGIWAPALSHDGDRFLVTYAVVRAVGRQQFDLDVYVCCAADPAGPWSAPVRLPSHGFDPSLFHEDGRTWLLNVQNDQRPDGSRFSGIVRVEVDRRTWEPLDSARLLTRHDVLMEGPKVLRRGGWYYVQLAEGGTGWEHGVRVARSRSLDGPYETCAEPLVTTRDRSDGDLAKAGHGEIVQAPDGRWFMAFLAARSTPSEHYSRVSTLGRETCIEEIIWDDHEWPRLVGGGHHPRREIEGPAVETTIAAVIDVPRAPMSLRESVDASWCRSTRTLEGSTVHLRGRHGIASQFTVSLLARPVEELSCSESFILDAVPSTFTQAAGAGLYYGTDAWAVVRLTWREPKGQRQEGQQWTGSGRRVVELLVCDQRGVRRLNTLEAPGTGAWEMVVAVEGSTARFQARPRREGTEGVTAKWTDLAGPVDISDLSDDVPGQLRFTGCTFAVYAEDTVDASWWAAITVPSTWRLEET